LKNLIYAWFESDVCIHWKFKKIGFRKSFLQWNKLIRAVSPNDNL
jgi:hypothetical protein